MSSFSAACVGNDFMPTSCLPFKWTPTFFDAPLGALRTQNINQFKLKNTLCRRKNFVADFSYFFLDWDCFDVESRRNLCFSIVS